MEAGYLLTPGQNIASAMSIGQSSYEAHPNSKGGDVEPTSQWGKSQSLCGHLMKFEFCPVEEILKDSNLRKDILESVGAVWNK